MEQKDCQSDNFLLSAAFLHERLNSLNLDMNSSWKFCWTWISSKFVAILILVCFSYPITKAWLIRSSSS